MEVAQAPLQAQHPPSEPPTLAPEDLNMQTPLDLLLAMINQTRENGQCRFGWLHSYEMSATTLQAIPGPGPSLPKCGPIAMRWPCSL